MNTQFTTALSLLCKGVGNALSEFGKALERNGNDTLANNEEQLSVRAGEGSADPADGGQPVRKRSTRF